MSVPASAECHLLPGLPHDLALACLARLFLWDLPAARCVSRAWAAAIRRQSFGRLRRRVCAERGGWTVAGRGERLCRRWAEGRQKRERKGKEKEKWKEKGEGLADYEGGFRSLPTSPLSGSQNRLPPMHSGPHLPGPGGSKACVSESEGHCDSPGAVLVVCVGGSNSGSSDGSSSEYSSSEDAGRQRLQWFACCVCEARNTCDPCRTSADLKAFPRWRRLPPLPPTNPHAHPACYGAAATVIPGTGFVIVGGAVPSQSGRPQHVRHVSVFDWHMGAWFAVQQPCMLPRLDPVVAAMGATSEGRTCGSIQKACAGRSNLGWRNCLVVVGGCPVPFFPRGSSAGSCGRVAVRPSEGRVVEHHPASSPPGASPSSHVRHPFLGVCTMCIAMPADGFGADECDNDERASNSRSESIHSSDSSSGGGGGSRAVTSSMLSGCSLTDGGSIREQYYQFPRLDSLVLGGRVFVRRHVSPYFAVNPGGFNRHAHRPAPPAHTTHGPGNRVTGTGGRAGGGSMVSEAGVVEVDWGSAEMWRVVEESDLIHAIWTETHVAQVIVADVTEADTVTVAGVTVLDVIAKPGEEDSPTSTYSSRAAQHTAPATYSVLCSLDPNHSLLLFNHLQRRWVPAGPPVPPPFPPRPPLPRPSPHLCHPCGRGSHGEYCSTPPCCTPMPSCTPMPPRPPTTRSNSHSAARNSHLPSCASNGAATSLVAGTNAADASSAKSARLQQLLGCGGRLVALFQPHDPRLPGVMREILLPDLHTLSSLSALLPHTSSASFPSSLPSRPSLSASSQPRTILSPPAAQAQASGSVPVAAGRESMQLMSSDSVEGRSGWAMGAPMALPGNGRLHHVLSMHLDV
ncbi:unnamed protein product [Closterium sp. NIES-53]